MTSRSRVVLILLSGLLTHCATTMSREELAQANTACSAAANGPVREKADQQCALAVTLAETSAPGSPEYITSLQNLVNLHLARGDLAGSLEPQLRLIAAQRAALGSRHPDLARSLADLGGTYSAQGKYALAEPYLAEALEIHRQAPGVPDARILQSLRGLETAYMMQQKWAKAEEAIYPSMVALHEKTEGPNGLGLANTLMKRSFALNMLEQFAPAQAAVERALKIRQDALGLEHPDTQDALLGLVMSQAARGQLEGAASTLTQLVAAAEKSRGKDDAKTVQWREALAILNGKIPAKAAR